MRKTRALMLLVKMILPFSVNIFLITAFSYAHVYAAYTPPVGGGYAPCSSTTWVTKGLADDDENGFHLHIQLQALTDQQDTSHYCGRVIGNAFLDEPVSAIGVLEVIIDQGRSKWIGGPFDVVYDDVSCNLPTQCTAISTDSVRGTSKFELGGPGYSIALDSANGKYSNYVGVYARFTQQVPDASQPGVTSTTTSASARTDTWKMSNLPPPIQWN